MSFIEELSEVEIAAIENGLVEIGSGTIQYLGVQEAKRLIRSLSNFPVMEMSAAERIPRETKKRSIKETSENAYSGAKSTEQSSRKKSQKLWQVGFSSSFCKEVEGFDNKLLGKVLKAITKISREPMNPIGDTIKPLTANFKGQWRYRIDDSYRLIYQPDTENQTVTILKFSNRGDVYQ